ncbi:MAG: hypothetical protein NT033_02080 [Candidatus Omnitrophica bacterium]|nr:hypothetical protein [Candidatus Omnitrophota bacterium]
MEYVIDAYNVIHHPLFDRINDEHLSPRLKLLASIRTGRLTGSGRNKIIVVFDGYPETHYVRDEDLSARIEYCRQKSADERMVEEFLNPILLKTIPPEHELTYTQKHKINQELKKIWLK